MQVNVTTEITDEDPNEDPIPNPLVERDLWEQAFEPFEGEHYAALRLGFNFFHDASFDLFIRLTEGKLSREEEQMLNALGIKTF